MQPACLQILGKTYTLWFCCVVQFTKQFGLNCVETLTYLGSSQPLAKLASKLSDLYSPSPTERKYKECLFGVHNTVETSLNSHLSWAVTSALQPCDNGLNRFPISLYRISLT